MIFEVKKEGGGEIVVESSRFIFLAKSVKNPAEVASFLEKLRKEHLKARHICYAYIIGNEKKFSDDGEPKGTAGKPILSILENNNLTNTAIFVIRYFGGTLLGSGRLLRTYSEAAKLAVTKSELVELIEEYLVEAEITYEIHEIFKHYLKTMHFNIIKTSFNDKIVIEFYVPLDFDFKDLDRFYKDLKIINQTKIRHWREDYGRL